MAFLLAPASPVLLFPIAAALRGTSIDTANWSAIPWIIAMGGYLPALVVGIPAYAVLSRSMRLSPVNCMIVGALIAAVPWFLLFAFVGPDYSSYGGEVMRAGRFPTVAGWQQLFGLFFQFAIYGAFGGLVFWSVAAASLRPSK